MGLWVDVVVVCSEVFNFIILKILFLNVGMCCLHFIMMLCFWMKRWSFWYVEDDDEYVRFIVDFLMISSCAVVILVVPIKFKVVLSYFTAVKKSIFDYLFD